MSFETIEGKFKEKICNEIRLMQEGKNRLRVFTPFMFDDGDHLCILLKQEDDNWYLTDEGHTFMHLSYDEIEISKGTRKTIIDTALSAFGIVDRDGELITKISDDDFGDALYSYIQGLIKVTDVTYLTRERAKSTFMEDFRLLFEMTVPPERRIFDYHDPQRDPDGKYIVDCRINGRPKPLFVFAVPGDDKCQVATITCLQYERFRIPFEPMAIFEDSTAINGRVFARFMDVCYKMYSNLYGNKDRINKFLEDSLKGG